MVTMKVNERSRLASEKGCRKGYYRVSPFMDEAKYDVVYRLAFHCVALINPVLVLRHRICGRVNNVPAFQWYIEDQQPENVTITLKHNGLNDGFSEGLGFTLSGGVGSCFCFGNDKLNTRPVTCKIGECLPDESDLTISKAVRSYQNWLEQLAGRPTGELTVVLPALAPLHPIISLWGTRPNVTQGSIQFPNVTTDDPTTPPTIQLSNSSPSSHQTDDSDHVPLDLPPTAVSPFAQSSNVSNHSLPQIDRDTEKADPVHLPIISAVVTDSPLPITTTFTSIPTTVQPSLSPHRLEPPVPEVPLLLSDHNSPPSNSFPMIRRRPLPTTKKPITRAPISRRPPTTMFPASRKRPAAQVSNDNPEIPWLILKSPGDSSLSEMHRAPSSTTPRPFITNHQQIIRPVRRRPLVRLPSTTVRPASSSSSNPWVILKSPQTNKIQEKTRPAPIRPKVPVVDHQGIPWLILDPQPSDSSSEIHYYPDVPSNELYKRKHSFPGYFVSAT